MFAVANTEIEMSVDTFYHHEIVLLVRAVNSCGAENRVRDCCACGEFDFSVDFRHSIGGVGHRNRTCREWLVVLFVAHAERAQAAHIEKSFGNLVKFGDDVEKAFEIIVVDEVEG